MDRPEVVKYLDEYLLEDSGYRGYFEIPDEYAVELAKYVKYLEEQVKTLEYFSEKTVGK